MNSSSSAGKWHRNCRSRVGSSCWAVSQKPRCIAGSPHESSSLSRSLLTGRCLPRGSLVVLLRRAEIWKTGFLLQIRQCVVGIPIACEGSIAGRCRARVIGGRDANAFAMFVMTSDFEHHRWSSPLRRATVGTVGIKVANARLSSHRSSCFFHGSRLCSAEATQFDEVRKPVCPLWSGDWQ